MRSSRCVPRGLSPKYDPGNAGETKSHGMPGNILVSPKEVDELTGEREFWAFLNWRLLG